MATDPRRLEPRKHPKQLRAELTRQRILAAAARVFADYGYAAGTTNHIARQARVSIGSLYQYYPSKDAILAELLGDHLRASAGAAELLRGPWEGVTLEAVLCGFVHAVIDNHLDEPHLLRVLLEQAPHTPGLMQEVAEVGSELVGHMQDLLAHHPDSRAADPRAAAKVAVNTVELVVHMLIAHPDGVEPRTLEQELTRMLTRYVTSE